MGDRMKLALGLLTAAALLLPAHAVASSPGAGESSRLVPALPLGTGTVDQIESLMATPPFDQGVWGLEVRDMATGKKLLGINIHRQFQAASTTKNFTTAAALDALGKNRRFRTPVTHTGRISPSGVVQREVGGRRRVTALPKAADERLPAGTVMPSTVNQSEGGHATHATLARPELGGVEQRGDRLVVLKAGERGDQVSGGR